MSADEMRVMEQMIRHLRALAADLETWLRLRAQPMAEPKTTAQARG